MNNKQTESRVNEVVAVEEQIELVNIEDLRTAFGGEDTAAPRETPTANGGETVMCGGW